MVPPCQASVDALIDMTASWADARMVDVCGFVVFAYGAFFVEGCWGAFFVLGNCLGRLFAE